MPCCCVKTLNLCSVPVCDIMEIEVEAIANESGADNNYKLVLDYLQTTITLSEEQTEGEYIHFDISMLNENFEFIGQVYDSNGDLVTIPVGEQNYDCIKFKTIIQIPA